LIVYPQKKYRSAKLRVFIEFMTALMADLRREGIVDESISDRDAFPDRR
jgi:LysR family transcriptional regulator, regulator for bpeEF and oprC